MNKCVKKIADMTIPEFNEFVESLNAEDALNGFLRLLDLEAAGENLDESCLGLLYGYRMCAKMLGFPDIEKQARAAQYSLWFDTLQISGYSSNPTFVTENGVRCQDGALNQDDLVKLYDNATEAGNNSFINLTIPLTSTSKGAIVAP